MTRVEIRRIGNGWLLVTSDLEWYFEAVELAGDAASRIAQMPSLNEELSRVHAQIKAMSDFIQSDRKARAQHYAEGK